jgi:4-hydroxythreonine-4-phosphate dehydrogenase
MKTDDVKKHKPLPVIGITMGDPVGVGPEIIIKALSNSFLFDLCCPVVLGDRALLEREIEKINATVKLSLIESLEEISFSPGTINLLPTSHLKTHDTRYGQPTRKTGKAMATYIEQAVTMAMNKIIDAVVTAPINKKSLHKAGYDYPGHTEMLARLTNTRDVVMMLAGEKLRVVLVTIHCAICQIPKLLEHKKILKTIHITNESLRKYFSIGRPRIAVAALNPHAGEAGLFGKEENEIILPAIEEAQDVGIDATGPYPPDTLFYYAAKGNFDVVVCMYHDQGLIPLKLIHFDEGVNITLGLPIIRTSVDHGTAYDIAGTNRANPASLLNAIRMAIQMAQS